MLAPKLTAKAAFCAKPSLFSYVSIRPRGLDRCVKKALVHYGEICMARGFSPDMVAARGVGDLVHNKEEKRSYLYISSL
tara:strand:- start:44 stop:280 length:237 start_codon:yes stop_codon:yes gene_type:complete